ncbi:MAG: GH25 family lysozyme [Endozoicomonas sp. (ex Botrylloides leachii)]|nr:GH25 family lysozyme [Endozoicomonas sp. (ex Botrylloides leachii)]
MKNNNNDKKIIKSNRLTYLVDFILVGIISCFMYYNFIKISEQENYIYSEINSKKIKIERSKLAANSEKPNNSSALLNGVDVSHYQGEVQWQQVADTYHFAFIKATEGTNYIDPRFQENINNIENTSMKYGAYHFFNPALDAIEQAKHFINTIAHENLSLPSVLDIEIEPIGSNQSLQASVKDWLVYVEKATGCRPIIYTNKHYWLTYLADHFTDYPLWIGDYTTSDNRMVSIPWAFWQYTDKGKVTGINGIVDKSHFDGNAVKLNKFSCI